MRLPRLYPDAGDVDLDDLATALGPRQPSTDDRPFVSANMVCSVDGRAAVAGRSGGLGGAGDKAMFSALRKTVDAVLVGAGTVRAERYGKMTPLAAVLTGKLDLPLDIGLFTDPDSRVAVYTAAPGPAPPVAAQVTLHRRPRAELTAAAVLRSLRADHGVRTVLCEGGPSLLGELVAGGLLDELFLTLSPTLVDEPDSPGILAHSRLDAPRGLTLRWVLSGEGGELLLRYGAAA